MTVNHAGVLSVEYFISYLELLMSARELSLEESRNWMEKEFFKGNALLYGESTHQSFLQALERKRR